MAAPLLWMLVTSVSTLEETRRFPPGLPSSAALGTTTRRPGTTRPFGAVAGEQHDRLDDLRGQQPRAVQPRRLRLRPAPRSRRSRWLFIGILATLMVPFQVVMIPTLLIVKHLRPGRHAPGADRAQPGRRRSASTCSGSSSCRCRSSSRRPRSIDGAGRLRILRSILLPADGSAAEHGRRADLPLGVERLPLAARRDAVARRHDGAARARDASRAPTSRTGRC